MDSCLFCRIVRGEIPSLCIRETEHTIAFLDIHPVHPGHTLVVPKKHARDIFEIPSAEWVATLEEVRALAPHIQAATVADGINIVMNNRKSAGQVIDHVHLHIIPRFERDGLHGFPQRDASRESLEPIAKAIRATFA